MVSPVPPPINMLVFRGMLAQSDWLVAPFGMFAERKFVGAIRYPLSLAENTREIHEEDTYRSVGR